MSKDKHYVYILECKDKSLYTGYTIDIEKRLLKHEQGKGAKYTRGRGPFQLVYVESFSQKKAALQREAEIKRLPRAKKLELVMRRLTDGSETI